MIASDSTAITLHLESLPALCLKLKGISCHVLREDAQSFLWHVQDRSADHSAVYGASC